MARKKSVYCSICGKRRVTKQTHCDICYENNADNCHHSKGMCPFEKDNNNIISNSNNGNKSNLKNKNKSHEKDNNVNNKIDKYLSTHEETDISMSNY